MASSKARSPRKAQAPPTTLNVAFVIDMSGSMTHIRNAAIEGANTYLRDLKDDENAETTRLTFIAFDDQYEVWNEDEPVTGIDYIGERYVPRGMTALHDAIAKTIGRLDQIMRGARSEEKALVVILTDGIENASQEYSGEEGRQRLAKLVESYEQRGNWTFVYLGANDYDVKKTAVGVGFAPGNAMAYSATGQSTSAAYASLSRATSALKANNMTATSAAFADAGAEDDVREEKDKK